MGNKYENLLGSGTENVVQSFFDNFLKSNADFRSDAGFKMTVTRESIGFCCEWCQSLIGTYDYDKRPEDIFCRHKKCSCVVTTETERGKHQDAWSRKEYKSQRDARIVREQEILEENNNNNRIKRKSLEDRIRAAAEPEIGTPIEYNPDAKFNIRITDYSDEVNESINMASKEVIDLAQDGKEHLILVDLNNGEHVYSETGDSVSCGGTNFWDFILKKENKEKSFAFVHSHATSGGFSEADMSTLLGRNPIDVFIAAQIDGKAYVVVRESFPETLRFDQLYKNELIKLNVDARNGKITPAERTNKREMIIVNNLVKDYTKGVKIFE